ncbi:MAG: hypothetical protein IJ468_14760 [Lachnospiraceae bacterium]|nr:hypothetical protein [Lachnospiraceae bacterium]
MFKFRNKVKIPSKYKTLKRLIKISDKKCISQYYTDPYIQTIPKPILEQYLDELAEEKYLKPRIRHVILLSKAYSYDEECRKALLNKIIAVFGRPITYLLTWMLGIASAVIIQYLINILNLVPNS